MKKNAEHVYPCNLCNNSGVTPPHVESTDVVYQPSDMLFAICIAKTPGEEDLPIIFFTTAAHWKEDPEGPDFITGRNFPSGVLQKCGVCEQELTEGQFMMEDESVSPEVITTRLLQAGFRQDPGFTKVILETTGPSYMR